MNTEEKPDSLMKKTNLRKFILYVILIGLAAFIILFAISLRMIYSGVESICEIASNKFETDNVESLISLIESDEFSFKQKNKAIWALGQIGDRRALPLLQKLDTDEIQKKPLDSDKYLVQYSVEKAIRQINSDFIITRWMYRWL